MNRKSDFSIGKSAYSKIKPAFRISLVLSALGVGGSPKAIMVVSLFDHVI